MSRDPDDDDALRWEGDDDPTLAPGWKRVGNPVEQPAETRDERGDTATAEVTDAAASVDDVEADAAAQPGSAELVLLGVFAGVYLLYSIGWILTVVGIGGIGGADPVAAFMFQVGLWLAVLAPALWYVAAFAATRERPRPRLAWLLVGAIVLVPFPFVLGVTA